MVRSRDPEFLVPAVLAGDRAALARILTLVENQRSAAEVVLRRVFPATGRAFVTGLTGAPGAGKSTITDRLIARIRSDGDEIAVLAVDPSSPFSGGAILGDRVRMQDHIDDAGVFIRSMASRGHLGGISEATPKALAVLDAAGFPEIIVETVGVGQAEVEIAAAAETTVVVVNPGWGDAIQAAKAGLLEVGDVFVVNKADRSGVAETVRDLEQMLDLGAPAEWRPPVITAVAVVGEGVDHIWDAVRAHRSHLEATGNLGGVRRGRLMADLEAAIAAGIERRAAGLLRGPRYSEIVTEVLERRLDPWSAADALLGDTGKEQP
jgi:LAO/AO transport system kinase